MSDIELQVVQKFTTATDEYQQINGYVTITPAPPAAFESVEAVISATAVPAVVECRGCGRRVEPMVQSRRPDGTACCMCGFCGSRFDYRHPGR